MDDIPSAEFDGEDFDAREVVQRYRRLVPLPQLQKSLRAHYAATRQELVELINEKYADFVSLSSRMQGVERALRPLRAPLEESAQLTRGLHSRLGAILQQAEEAHGKLAGIQTRRDALQVYIKNAKLLDKAKAAAAQRRANPQESDDLMREYIAQENVARDLRRIRLNLGGNAPTKPAPKVDKSAPKVNAPSGDTQIASDATAAQGEELPAEWQSLLAQAAEFEEEFATGLTEKLRGLIGAVKRSWSSPDSDASGAGNPLPRSEIVAISHVSRSLVTLSRAHQVEAAFIDVFVREVLESTTSSGSAGSDAAAPSVTSMGAMDLGAFFRTVRSALLAEGAPLLWLARRLRGSSGDTDASADAEDALLAVPSLHLVANVAVVPVLQHIQRVWDAVFMPAFPDVFAANHGHATRFIRDVQALMAPAELRTFSQGAALAEFQKRWKTQVYASLRSKEATQRLEASADAAPSSPDGSGPARRVVGSRKFWLEASAEVVRLLHMVWGDKWYLESLYPKMAQLSMVLLARYGKIVKALADGAADAPLANAWDANAGAWTSTSLPVRLSCAAADVLEVLAEVACGEEVGSSSADGATAQFMLQQAPGGAGDRPAQIARSLLREASAGLQPVIDVLCDAALKQVAAAAQPQYNVRGIPTRFRMLDKPLPTKASPYVDSVLRPVRALHEAALRAAPADAVVGWVRKAVDEAANEFAVQAAQLLESTRQQEASLRRLVAGRGSGGSEVTDLDKIHVQLCLDIETFTQAASELGAPDAPGLAKLSAAVESVWPTYRTHRPEGTPLS